MKTIETKRSEAQKRNDYWFNLTTQEQIKQLANRPGESKRQVARLNAKIAQANEQAKAETEREAKRTEEAARGKAIKDANQAKKGKS